jgi:multidrug efflux system outer membrane protein
MKRGVASKLDLAQVRQAVETAKANLALYTRRVMQDQNALVLLMGVKTLDPSLQTERLDDVAVLEKLPVGLPSEVLLVRPDVRQAEHELLSSNANIGAARAAFFPTISLTGTFGYASSDLGDLFSSAASGAWSFAPQITLPIFQGGA